VDDVVVVVGGDDAARSGPISMVKSGWSVVVMAARALVKA